MKKGLRNTLASAAFAMAAALPGQTKAEDVRAEGNASEVKVARLVEAFKKNAENRVFENLAEEALEEGDLLRDLFKAPLDLSDAKTPMQNEGTLEPGEKDLFGIGAHLREWGRYNEEKYNKGLDKFVDDDFRLDLSKCAKIVIAAPDGEPYVALYTKEDLDPKKYVIDEGEPTPEEDPSRCPCSVFGVLNNDDEHLSFSVTDADIASVFGERADKLVIVDPQKGTYKVKWLQLETESPDIHFEMGKKEQEKSKTTKAPAPQAKSMRKVPLGKPTKDLQKALAAGFGAQRKGRG